MTPTPDELAGTNVRGFEDVKVTPDGRYLAFSAPEAGKSSTVILDVASNALIPVESENKLSVTSMTGTTMYATAEDVTGAAFVGLTTGAATALASGTAPIAVDERVGVFNAGGSLVVARRRG